MLNKKLLWALGLISVGVLLTAGYNRPYRWWPVNDMSEQQIIKPFNTDSLRTPPEGSVAVDAWEPAPTIMTVATWEGKNPIPLTDESVAMGKATYDIMCKHCHGPDFGLTPDAKAPVQTGKRPDGVEFMIMPAAPISLVVNAQRTDEYIYAVISSGSAIMRRLDYHLDPEERWHVVNYVRSLANQYKAQNPQ
ncbi:MAG: c-type cytochrome [Acidobacteriota bacterium]|nr:c-type cytochrome [Acidobacteriota bacterium]